jgi:hypothetical protein
MNMIVTYLVSTLISTKKFKYFSFLHGFPVWVFESEEEYISSGTNDVIHVGLRGCNAILMVLKN